MNAMDGGVGGLSPITTAVHVQRTYFQHTCTILGQLVNDSATNERGASLFHIRRSQTFWSLDPYFIFLKIEDP